MNYHAEMMERLKREQDPAAEQARQLLAGEPLEQLSGEPASTTAHEALRLWRTRLLNTRRTKQQITGLQELVERLSKTTPQKLVDHFQFRSDQGALTLLFERSSGAFLGSAAIRSSTQK